MKQRILLPIAMLASLLWLSSNCTTAQGQESHQHAQKPAATHAVAVMHPTAGNKCKGVIHFTQAGGSVKVVAQIEGLNPNQKHAFHIHEFGDSTAADGMSAGGHYNPEGHAHGLTDKPMRHAGDLGNLQADANGRAKYEITVSNVSIAGTKNPIIGRGVIIHAKTDDGGQPVGNAGARISCGVIGIAKAGN